MPTDPHAEAPAASPPRATGPVTVEGKARSAMNATRHGICAVRPTLGPDADTGELDALRAALVARHQPHDAAEAHWVEELVFVAWRQERLRALEAAVLARAMEPEPEGDAPALPSLATLIRYRARLERDWRRAGEALDELRYARQRLLPRPRLRTMADAPELPATPRTNEPARPAPQGTLPDAPDRMPPLNRHQRRALKAMERQGRLLAA